MTCHGVVKDSAIVLPPGVSPPEGAEVVITVVEKTPVEERPKEQGERRSPWAFKNGVPVFDPVEGAPEVTLELVNRLRDESP